MAYGHHPFIEFPKWIEHNGKDILVQSREEEDSYLPPKTKKEAVVAAATVPVLDLDKDDLINEAAEHGVNIDKRWSAQRILDEINSVIAERE
jgi:hypothetical protein